MLRNERQSEPRPKHAEAIRDLAHRLDRLRPDHRYPERFHEEKSEIAFELTEIAGRMSGWPYCTSKWKRLRLAKLAESPCCTACEWRGQTIEAFAVDHITPIRRGGNAFPPLNELMSLCERCHNEKTASFDRQGGNVLERRLKGCGLDGNPVDVGGGWFQ